MHIPIQPCQLVSISLFPPQELLYLLKIVFIFKHFYHIINLNVDIFFLATLINHLFFLIFINGGHSVIEIFFLHFLILFCI